MKWDPLCSASVGVANMGRSPSAALAHSHMLGSEPNGGIGKEAQLLHYSVLHEGQREEGSGTMSQASLPRQLSYTQDGRHLGSGCGLLGTVRRFPNRDQGKGPSRRTQLRAFSKAGKPRSGSSLGNPRQGRKCESLGPDSWGPSEDSALSRVTLCQEEGHSGWC